MIRAVLLAAAFTACSPIWKSKPHDALVQGDPSRLHRAPESTQMLGVWSNEAKYSIAAPLGKLVSPDYYLQASGVEKPALDVNLFGQVPDSSWFENRLLRGELPLQRFADWPPRDHAPADGPLLVVSGKMEGVSPGFVVLDTQGTRWFVKFDLPAYPRLATAAEIIATRLLYAAGYNVPENYIVDLSLDRLRLGANATTRGKYNQEVELTEERLQKLLTQLSPGITGEIHALFSRAVEGEPIGPTLYVGTREDDPNDTIPHQHRRSLRGLWVFFAWLNNTDASAVNTLDTFVRVDGGLGYVRHYLLDFDSSLGAAEVREKTRKEGYEQRVGWWQIGHRLASLGFSRDDWTRVERTPFRSIGIFESEIFDPAEWYPTHPNPAFQLATKEDTFWAASILARIGEGHIRSAVGRARLREDAAGDWLVLTLMRRRQKILEYAFSGLSVLDAPRVAGDTLQMDDLMVIAGLREPGQERYYWDIRWNRSGLPDVQLGQGVTREPRLDLGPHVAAIRASSDPFVTVTARKLEHGRRQPPVLVHLRVTRDAIVPVALERIEEGD